MGIPRSAIGLQGSNDGVAPLSPHRSTWYRHSSNVGKEVCSPNLISYVAEKGAINQLVAALLSHRTAASVCAAVPAVGTRSCKREISRPDATNAKASREGGPGHPAKAGEEDRSDVHLLLLWAALQDPTLASGSCALASTSPRPRQTEEHPSYA